MMIVAIERSKFIYLYKYNEISIDATQVIDSNEEKIINDSQENKRKLIDDFNRILPIFEQDHEVILLEIDKNYISIECNLKIRFKAVLSIYPLTSVGNQLLQGKINDNFIINKPVFEDIIEEVKIIRTLKSRKLAAINILNLFSLKIDNQDLNLISQVLKKVLLSKNSAINFNSYLDYLIAYNKTPNNIPDGNVEFLCKIGVIVLNYLKIDEINFFKGPFYKSCLQYSNVINEGGIFNSYTNFIELKDNDLIMSLEKLKSNIDFDLNNIDIFKASYFFLAYKSFLNKNDKNLELLKIEIDKLIFDDENTAAFVLIMIGYTFSFESLYESLHTLNKVPLVKVTVNQLFLEKPLINNSSKIDKKTKEKTDNCFDGVENRSQKELVSENVSVPIVIYEKTIDNRENTDLNLFPEDNNIFSENKLKVEEFKSVEELLNWIASSKSISKSSQNEWKKFIEKSLKYGSYSLHDVLTKVKNEKLEKKLTAKMLKDLELFFIGK